MGRQLYLSILLVIAISAMAGAAIGSRIVTAESAPGQAVKTVDSPKLQKWEYRFIDGYNTNEGEKAANNLGEQGFELLNTTNSGTIYHLAFRRAKPQ